MFLSYLCMIFLTLPSSTSVTSFFPPRFLFHQDWLSQDALELSPQWPNLPGVSEHPDTTLRRRGCQIAPWVHSPESGSPWVEALRSWNQSSGLCLPSIGPTTHRSAMKRRKMVHPIPDSEYCQGPIIWRSLGTLLSSILPSHPRELWQDSRTNLGE